MTPTVEQASPVPANTISSTLTQTSFPTRTQTPVSSSRIIIPTSTQTPSFTPGPSPTPTGLPNFIPDFPEYIEQDGEILWFGDTPCYVTAWSPDGSIIAVGFEEGIFFLNAESLKTVKILNSPAVDHLQFSLDGRYLAGNYDTRLAIWDVESGELVQVLGEDVYFSSYSMIDDNAIDQGDIFFSQDGKRILFKENDSVQVWDVEQKKKIAEWEYYYLNYLNVSLSPDGKLVALTKGSEVDIMDVDSAEILKVYPLDSSYSFFNSTGEKLLSGNSEKLIEINLKTDSQQVYTVKENYETVFYLNERIFAGYTPGKREPDIFTWDGEIKAELYVSWEDQISISISPSGDELAVLDAENNLYIWDIKNQTATRWEDAFKFYPYKVYPTQDGSYLFLLIDERLYKMDTYSGEFLYILDPQLRNSYYFSFSPSGREFATIYQELGAQVWDFESGELLQETLLAEGASSSQDNLLIHQSFELPNGSIFTAWKWAESETWITNSNDVLPPTCDYDFLFYEAISPDGSLLAVRIDEDVRLMDTNSGNILPDSPQWPDVNDCTFSPDGKYFLTRRLISGNVDVWDLETYDLLITLEYTDSDQCPTDCLREFSFTSDGSRLLSLNHNRGLIEIWNTQTWELDTSFLSLPQPYNVKISGDGNMVVLVKGEKVYFWSLDE